MNTGEYMYTPSHGSTLPEVSAENPSLSLKLSPFCATVEATRSMWFRTER